MASFKIFFPISFFFLTTLRVSANITSCGTARCKPDGAPVHFPFRLKNRQPSSCAYASGTGRFDLACDKRNQTVIRLQSGSGYFSVDDISYDEQSILINDPDNCLPRRFLNKEFTNFTSETFKIYSTENYTFLNCSKDATSSSLYFTVTCLGSSGDRAVYAIPTRYRFLISPSNSAASPASGPVSSSGCSEIGNVEVPVSPRSFTGNDPFSDLTASVRLTWSDPDCRDCIAGGGDCRYLSGSSSEIGCSVSSQGSSSSSTGLPRSAKYGIVIGVGIPGILCIIGLASYICGRVRACRRRHRPYHDYASSDMPERPVVVQLGLDRPTIESFPKIELGESKRLPKPSDNTCPICLSDYQPKETLRTIPECNHYFHASCVDEWLKMNATCPICRNSPDGSTSSHISSSTSVSLSSSSLLSP